MFTLAHLSDIHLSPMPRPTLRQLMSKRILGYANWLRGRRDFHRRTALDALTLDLKKQDAGHIAVTGDLVNIGLPAEFEAARDWLQELGPAQDISVVPGNHDAYVKLDFDRTIGLWRDYIRGDAQGMTGLDQNSQGFPYVRIREPVAMIGLSTAIPTLPFMAAGELDDRQLEALPTLLRDLRERKLFRVILIHHPPLPGLTGHRRGLRNAPDLLTILQREGVELMLYGHNHEQSVDQLDVLSGSAFAVGVPSASASRAGYHPLARYNLFRISRYEKGWKCTMTGRGFDAPNGQIVELEKRQLIG